MTRDTAIVTIENVNRKSYALCRMVTFPMTSNDPYPCFQGYGILEVEYLKNGAFYAQCY